MMANIDIAAEVQAQLSRGDLDLIRNIHETRSCAVCGIRVQVGTEDTAIVVDIYLDGRSVGFVHRRCAASQVRYVGTEMPEPDEDVSVLAMLQPHAGGTRAVLLFTTDAKMAMLSGSGEALDATTAGLLSSGWTLLRTVGKVPELLADWKVTLDPHSQHGAIVNGQDISFLDDLPTGLPPDWIETLVTTGELTILSGAIDLDAINAAQNPLKALNEYGRRGVLIGARVPVTLVDIPADPFQATGRRLASKLQRAMARVASSEGIREDALVPLESSAEFKPVRTDSGNPMLFVDLCDDDEGRVTAVLAELKALGFPSGTSDDIKHHLLCNAPKGWACVVWPSQIQIFLNRISGAPRQLWFAPLSYTDIAWFRDVRRVMAIGLVVGNKFPTDVDPLDLINDLRHGRVLGAGVPAMCTS
jgi:hypothetical protein